MRRALISACAVVGLMLGYCSQPREIHAADVYDRQGEKEKSRAGLERIVKELPGTEYARRAGAWMENPAYPVEQRTCVGCHQAAK